MQVILAFLFIGAATNANVIDRISIGNYLVDVLNSGLVIGNLPAPYNPCAVPDTELVPPESEEELPSLIVYLPVIDTMLIEVDDDQAESDVEYLPDPDIDVIGKDCNEEAIIISNVRAIDTMPIELDEGDVESDVEYLPEPEIEVVDKTEEGILVFPEAHPVVKSRTNEQDTLPIETDPDDPHSNVEYLPEPDIDYEYKGDQWRAVENIQIDTTGWIPDQPQLPKVRRLRKRKRRPQVVSLTGDTDVAENNYPVRRLKRPQHLHEESQHLWSQMEEDSRIKPNKRRRITPSFNDNQGELETNIGEQISVFQADEAVSGETKSTSSTNGIPYLKTILKQAGGLSLSEVLQQKNLSLSDLLKGEKEAILAITEKPDNQVITEYKNPVEDDFPKKNKYSSNYRFTSTRSPYISTTESSKHIVHTERRPYEDSTHRISVKPNNVIVVDFKPSLIGLDTFRKQSDIFDSASKTVTTVKTNIDVIPKLTNRLPITSAKLNKILKSTAKTLIENEVYPTTLPSKAYKININELFGLSVIQQKPKNDEGPLRMSLDLNSVLEKKVESSITASPETTTLETIPDKLKTITAKDEITEILKDEETKTFLKKILELRNMSFEDLVELRERGSSQKHLADLFQNKTTEPHLRNGQSSNSSAELEMQNKEPIVTLKKDEKAIVNKYQLERQAKSSHFPIAVDSDGDRYIASVEPIEESNESKSIEETKDREKYTVTSFPTYKIELDKKYKEKSPTPISDTWKSNYPDLFNDFYKRTHQKGIVEDLNEGYFDELKTIDEVENTVAESSNQKLSVETTKEIYEDTDDYNVFIKLPYGVKHAIFASLLIIGISLVIFLTILMIFKWSQKHKKRLCYNRSFSCSKIKSPILPGASDRRSFRTFMSETLGKRKRYYKQHLQSVSDAIWENDAKPFQ
ncbi:hypothetical protein MML48_4g00008673 [Holotrichia oblita]|uniref:Uncharacterized protein n=1 Tax=Holotrichia oblita TaxID=644536 RepID=A0ACB9T9X7_HOLOL|nr:hypothetical protein MML48_4g00008673 [Holotrichia oblita]